jgi:hypothetical protein
MNITIMNKWLSQVISSSQLKHKLERKLDILLEQEQEHNELDKNMMN